MNTLQRAKRQSGFIASYILYGIGLLAIVGVAYGRLNMTNQQGRVVQQTVEDVASQLEIIRGKVLLCAAIYPDGDHLQFNTRHAYPAPASVNNRDLVSNVEWLLQHCFGLTRIGKQHKRKLQSLLPVRL